MERPEPTRIRTVTVEEGGVITLTEGEFRRLGLRPGDKVEVEIVDEESFRLKKVPQQ